MRVLSLALAAAFLSGCGTMEIGERNFIRPNHVPGAPHTDLASHVETGTLAPEQIDAGGGAILRGVSWRSGSDLALLYFGGNAFNLDKHGAEALKTLTSCGVNVTMFDHRGYGRSSGKPTVALMAADGLRAFDLLNARYPGRVIIHGQSLGSFIAAHVAQQRPAARALVLESTSSTVQDWTDANVPWYVRMVSKVEVEPALRQVDNVRAARAWHGPALLLVGENDTITPPQLARKVFEALPSSSKKWVMAPRAGHNDVLTSDAGTLKAYCGFVAEPARP